MDAGVRESSEALGGAGPKLGRIGFVRLGAWPSLCLCVLAYLWGGGATRNRACTEKSLDAESA